MSPEDTILVIIDVQVRLAAAMPERDRLIDRLVRLVRGAHALGVPVIATEQIPAKLGPTVPEVAALLPEAAIAKSSFSCAGSGEFLQRLDRAQRTHVLLAGIETHVCVYQTAADLLGMNRYRLGVVADAVASRDAEHRRIALDRMASLGAGLYVGEMALFEMMRTAEHPAFRSVLNIVK